MSENQKEFTKSQLVNQAGAFRLLNKRVSEYLTYQGELPDYLQDEEGASLETVGLMARWILEEHEQDLKPIEEGEI